MLPQPVPDDRLNLGTKSLVPVTTPMHGMCHVKGGVQRLPKSVSQNDPSMSGYEHSGDIVGVTFKPPWHGGPRPLFQYVVKERAEITAEAIVPHQQLDHLSA